MNTISVLRGPRPSNQSCGLPSIWSSSPNRGRRWRSWNTRFARRFFCRHRPRSICCRRTVSAETLDLVQFLQLLRRQRGAEIGVFLLQQGADPGPKIVSHAPMRRPAPLARHKTGITAGPPIANQTLELAHPDPKTLRCFPL